tara:strand:+ start:9457 stop:9564 length:108 start_codon:yes stop_codon:yes gene_type:complete
MGEGLNSIKYGGLKPVKKKASQEKNQLAGKWLLKP